jgi:hypothetical protein
MRIKFIKSLNFLLALALLGCTSALQGQTAIQREDSAVQKPVAPQPATRFTCKTYIYAKFASGVHPTIVMDARGIAMTGIAAVDSISVIYKCKAITKRYSGEVPKYQSQFERCYVLTFKAAIDVETARARYMETGAFTEVTIVGLTPMKASPSEGYILRVDPKSQPPSASCTRVSR